MPTSYNYSTAENGSCRVREDARGGILAIHSRSETNLSIQNLLSTIISLSLHQLQGRYQHSQQSVPSPPSDSTTHIDVVRSQSSARALTNASFASSLAHHDLRRNQHHPRPRPPRPHQRTNGQPDRRRPDPKPSTHHRANIHSRSSSSTAFPRDRASSSNAIPDRKRSHRLQRNLRTVRANAGSRLACRSQGTAILGQYDRFGNGDGDGWGGW